MITAHTRNLTNLGCSRVTPLDRDSRLTNSLSTSTLLYSDASTLSFWYLNNLKYAYPATPVPNPKDINTVSHIVGWNNSHPTIIIPSVTMIGKINPSPTDALTNNALCVV